MIYPSDYCLSVNEDSDSDSQVTLRKIICTFLFPVAAGEMTSTVQMISRQSEKERWLQGLPSTWPNRTVDINIGSSPVF